MTPIHPDQTRITIASMSLTNQKKNNGSSLPLGTNFVLGMSSITLKKVFSTWISLPVSFDDAEEAGISHNICEYMPIQKVVHEIVTINIQLSFVYKISFGLNLDYYI